ncbi:MAG: TRAP transporter substrate-binding protein [Firmicutes bacterium]|nr:TRAP transporter substrate-binding protein [Bacillota bacterium]
MKKLLLVLLLCLSCFALFACANQGTDADTPDGSDAAEGDAAVEEANVVLQICHVEAETDSLQTQGLAFGEYVKEQSNGTITVEMYPNSEMGDDNATTEAVTLGTVAMSLPGTSQAAMYASDFGICDMPYIFTSYEQAFEMLDGELGDALNAELEGTGLKNLGFYLIGERNVSNNVRPINTPEDMKGLDIRCMESPVYISMFKAMGANPTPMAFSELYTAMSNGTVDGEDNPASVFYTSKFQEVQKYYSLTGHTYSFGCVLISETLWNSLSENQQNIIQEGVKTYLIDGQRQKKIDETDHYLELIEAEGCAVNEVSEENKALFKEAVQPVYDELHDTISDEIWALVE